MDKRIVARLYGIRTTLRQPSSFFLEDLVSIGSFGERHMVADNDLGMKFSRFDMSEQLGQKTLHVGLTHPERQTFLEGIAEKESMDESRVNARYADCASPANCRDTLAQRFTTAAFKLQVGQNCFKRTAFRFKPYGIDGCVHASKGCVFNNDFSSIDFIEIDRDDIVCLAGEFEPVRMVIDHENFFHAQHASAGGCH